MNFDSPVDGNDNYFVKKNYNSLWSKTILYTNGQHENVNSENIKFTMAVVKYDLKFDKL